MQGDPEVTKLQYRYDPRVCWIEDRYYVTWCNGYHGPTIGVAYTHDFETFHQTGERLPAVQPQRRAVPAQDRRQVRHAQPPQRQRPHTLWRHLLQREPDMVHWGQHRWVMGTKGGWQSTKIGAGPTPIETRKAGC